MARTMFDTTDIPSSVIPAGAQIVAGYVNGRYQSYWDMVKRYPNAEHVSIAVTVHADADVLDVEQGDATPDQTHDWIARQKSLGTQRPSIYCEASAIPAVRAGTREYVLGVDYDMWDAHYDSRASLDYAGTVAKQYIDHGPHGENYDMSFVADDAWPHRTAVTPPPPPPDPVSPPPVPPLLENFEEPIVYSEEYLMVPPNINLVPGQRRGIAVVNESGKLRLQSLYAGPSEGGSVHFWLIGADGVVRSESEVVLHGSASQEFAYGADVTLVDVVNDSSFVINAAVIPTSV